MLQEAVSGYKPIREQYGGFRPHTYIALFELDAKDPEVPRISEKFRQFLEEYKNILSAGQEKSHLKSKKSNGKKHL